jgi:hypothetical protein
MKRISIIAVLLSVLSSCKESKGLDVYSCNSIDPPEFYSHLNQRWPGRKPRSVVDAIKLLDSISDKSIRCGIIKLGNGDLYFSLGLKIRNDWVNNGTTEFKDQLFNRLRFQQPEYTSGFIIEIYRQLLLNKSDSLLQVYLENTNDTLINRKKELLQIQQDIYNYSKL